MFNIAVFSCKPYDRQFLTKYAADNLNFTFLDSRFDETTAQLAKGHHAVCIFVNDEVNKAVIDQLISFGIHIVALRCAGFNNVDITYAKQKGIKICRVPEYSSEAVAEHTVGLMLTLSRKFHKAYNRVREDNFSLDGLLGFNLHNKTVGIVGTGHIGMATLRILKGFGCQLICNDPVENPEAKQLGANYVDFEALLKQSDIVSLHCPLTPDSYHIMDQGSLQKMKKGAMLINTSRGGLIDSQAVLQVLKSQHLGYLGIDVYELESDLFFENLSNEIIQDDVFARLLTFPNVVITGHQGFFTEEALTVIAKTTIQSLVQLLSNKTINDHLLL